VSGSGGLWMVERAVLWQRPAMVSTDSCSTAASSAGWLGRAVANTALWVTQTPCSVRSDACCYKGPRVHVVRTWNMLTSSSGFRGGRSWSRAAANTNAVAAAAAAAAQRPASGKQKWAGGEMAERLGRVEAGRTQRTNTTRAMRWWLGRHDHEHTRRKRRTHGPTITLLNTPGTNSECATTQNNTTRRVGWRTRTRTCRGCVVR
jgi:hypothetical protein